MLAIRKKLTFFAGFACMLSILLLFSCRKMVEVDPPAQYVVTETMFKTVDGATSAVYGMYDQLRLLVVNRELGAFNGLDLPRLTALYSDEYILTLFNSAKYEPFYQNALESEDVYIARLWGNLWQLNYRANAIMEGIEKHGANLPDSLQKQFTGEAKFVRAWAHFVLVNLWGDVPLILSTDHNVNRLASRSPQATVYQQIVSDLLSAKQMVQSSYLTRLNTPANAMERVRANKDVVTAFLSKVYLYMGEWQKTEALASEVLANTADYGLNPNIVKDNTLQSIFDNNSLENIWQSFESQYYAHVLYDLSSAVIITNHLGYLSDSVRNKFEAGDNRRTFWVGVRTHGSNTWYYVWKYRSTNPSGNAGRQYLPLMRVAELYLIRAEARIQQNQVASGIEDLNLLRARARAAATTAVPNPVPNLPPTLSKTNAMLALEKEWTREMFMEGHRWFNLKRWKGINNPGITRADEVMPSVAAAKGVPWQPNKKLFPIPLADLEKNKNLVQNAGY